MHVLYPESPLDRTRADDLYHEEFTAVQAAGYPCSLFDFDALMFDEFQPRPRLKADSRVLYRGWMLNAQNYQTLATQIGRQGSVAITSPAQYLRCHYLPGWYAQCAEFTAETHFFDANEDIRSHLEKLGWREYFVKDFVKSNTAEKGSIARSVPEVLDIVEQISMYRGEIEGGIAIRKVEDYQPGTERRYFVVNGHACSIDGTVPELIEKIAARIQSPFYSVDIACNTKGEFRLIELGDGQVSARKEWPLLKFVEMLTKNESEGRL